jgi:hypothetical protein
MLRVLGALYVGILAAPASACTCEGEDAPSALRAVAEIVIEGEIVGVEELPSRLETLSRATIRVVARPRGARLPDFIRVDTAASSEACGYRFRAGEKREFVIRRFGNRLVTNQCLMQAARGRPVSGAEDRTTTP